jgi:hypothetical protein
MHKIHILILGLVLMGCYSSRTIEPEEMNDVGTQYSSRDIRKVVTKDDRTIVFDESDSTDHAPTIVEGKTLVAYAEGKQVSFPLSELSRLYLEKAPGTVEIVVASAAIAGAVIGIVALIRYVETHPIKMDLGVQPDDSHNWHF